MTMRTYDAIIVGGGFAGAIMARELAFAKKRVLILEAGPRDLSSRQDLANHFFTSGIKLPESPYPPYALSPQDSDSSPDRLYAQRYTSMMQFNWPAYNSRGTQAWAEGIDSFNANSHVLVDPTSPLPLLSTYERLVGGTTWHWLGTCLRLLPSDLRMKTLYDHGTDWPIAYGDLGDDYVQAEKLITVSAEASEQGYLGISFPKGYDYPKPPIASTYSDKQLGMLMQGLTIDFDGEPLAPTVTNTPQGRISKANGESERACRGNNSCIPLCPIGAKYDATRTLAEAMSQLDGDKQPYVELLHKTVACRLDVDPATRRITSVFAKTYDREQSGNVREQSFTAPVIVVAAHAIETVRLLLNSAGPSAPKGVANSSGQVGKNLMDHIVYLSWGLSPVPLYPFRGPRSTSGIESLRDGKFRSRHAAFRVDIGNEGWGWSAGAPASTVASLLKSDDPALAHGSAFVTRLNDQLTRMMRFCFLVEQEPLSTNCVTRADATDGLGNARAKVSYEAGDYALRGIAKAIKTTKAIFDHSRIQNYTVPNVKDPGYPSVTVDVDGTPQDANVYGAGHIMGTYRMGTDSTQAVVNADQQSFDHSNLFLLGSGTFPTVGTANPTLTIAALAFRASRAVLKQLAPAR
jgi:choline dehydrogenase-like flavoprotein